MKKKKRKLKNEFLNHQCVFFVKFLALQIQQSDGAPQLKLRVTERNAFETKIGLP